MEKYIFVQVPAIRSVKSFVRKRLIRWIQERKDIQSEMAAGLKVKTRVYLRRIGQGHGIFCQITLNVGRRSWSSSALAGGLHDAVSLSLHHLKSARACYSIPSENNLYTARALKLEA